MQQLSAPSGCQHLPVMPQLPCLQNARQQSKRGMAALRQCPLLEAPIPGTTEPKSPGRTSGHRHQQSITACYNLAFTCHEPPLLPRLYLMDVLPGATAELREMTNSKCQHYRVDGSGAGTALSPHVPECVAGWKSWQVPPPQEVTQSPTHPRHAWNEVVSHEQIPEHHPNFLPGLSAQGGESESRLATVPGDGRLSPRTRESPSTQEGWLNSDTAWEEHEWDVQFAVCRDATGYLCAAPRGEK